MSGWFAVMVAAAIALNVSADIYGVFRNTRGRHLVDYGDDRIAKYLLSQRYVPENFDAILVGPSVSSNWDLHPVRTLRIYNESMNGSNFVEQECLVGNAVQRPGLQFALLVMHPSMTADHDFSTIQLTPRENWGALGSVSLFEAYKDWLSRIRHSDSLVTDDYGTDFFIDPVRLNAVAAKMMTPGKDFEIDPIAYSAFKRTLKILRSHHIKVVYLFPPTYSTLFTPKKIAFSHYRLLITKEMSAEEPSVDFMEGRFRDFWCDRANFSDGVHISRPGTRKMVALLDGELAALRRKGVL